MHHRPNDALGGVRGAWARKGAVAAADALRASATPSAASRLLGLQGLLAAPLDAMQAAADADGDSPGPAWAAVRRHALVALQEAVAPSHTRDDDDDARWATALAHALLAAAWARTWEGEDKAGGDALGPPRPALPAWAYAAVVADLGLVCTAARALLLAQPTAAAPVAGQLIIWLPAGCVSDATAVLASPSTPLAVASAAVASAAARAAELAPPQAWACAAAACGLVAVCLEGEQGFGGGQQPAGTDNQPAACTPPADLVATPLATAAAAADDLLLAAGSAPDPWPPETAALAAALAARPPSPASPAFGALCRVRARLGMCGVHPCNATGCWPLEDADTVSIVDNQPLCGLWRDMLRPGPVASLPPSLPALPPASRPASSHPKPPHRHHHPNQPTEAELAVAAALVAALSGGCVATSPAALHEDGGLAHAPARVAAAAARLLHPTTTPPFAAALAATAMDAARSETRAAARAAALAAAGVARRGPRAVREAALHALTLELHRAGAPDDGVGREADADGLGRAACAAALLDPGAALGALLAAGVRDVAQAAAAAGALADLPALCAWQGEPADPRPSTAPAPTAPTPALLPALAALPPASTDLPWSGRQVAAFVRFGAELTARCAIDRSAALAAVVGRGMDQWLTAGGGGLPPHPSSLDATLRLGARLVADRPASGLAAVRGPALRVEPRTLARLCTLASLRWSGGGLDEEVAGALPTHTPSPDAAELAARLAGAWVRVAPGSCDVHAVAASLPWPGRLSLLACLDGDTAGVWGVQPAALPPCLTDMPPADTSTLAAWAVAECTTQPPGNPPPPPAVAIPLATLMQVCSAALVFASSAPDCAAALSAAAGRAATARGATSAAGQDLAALASGPPTSSVLTAVSAAMAAVLAAAHPDDGRRALLAAAASALPSLAPAEADRAASTLPALLAASCWCSACADSSPAWRAAGLELLCACSLAVAEGGDLGPAASECGAAATPHNPAQTPRTNAVVRTALRACAAAAHSPAPPALTRRALAEAAALAASPLAASVDARPALLALLRAVLAPGPDLVPPPRALVAWAAGAVRPAGGDVLVAAAHRLGGGA